MKRHTRDRGCRHAPRRSRLRQVKRPRPAERRTCLRCRKRIRSLIKRRRRSRRRGPQRRSHLSRPSGNRKPGLAGQSQGPGPG
jgi:hypothetical protein